MSHTQNVNERLAALTAAGTSVWLDQIQRSLVETGELQRMVVEDSLRGMTSNPAIFEKAILGSEDYDEQLEELVRELGIGADPKELYRAIAFRDVQEAADVLRPVYDETDAYDGYVSLEVDPDLAHDSDATIAQAREYWHAVDRPNLFIKIPGTDEGALAIEQAIYEGINVNVTLLFAVSAYEKIAEAYILGLERRHAEGLPLNVHSVASFFVSRVDTEVDKRLGDEHPELHGRAGIANARAAYQRFKELFHGERFATLLSAGATVQRPLWASTGTKNPAYSETLYVDNLVAPETVNTMPMATLLAAGRQTEITGATADQDPSADLQALADAGIDLDDVTAKLLRDGIAAFVTPMEKLLAGIDAKREALATHRPATIAASLPAALEAVVAERVGLAVDNDVAARLWRKDDTLWGPAGQPEVADRLGWLTIAARMGDALPELEAFASEVVADGFTDVVLLGMGGSSLAPEVIWRSFGPRDGHLRLHLLDSTDAAAIHAVGDAVDLDQTLFLVSTKSGGTIETLSAFAHFWALKPDGAHFAAITDPGSGLVDLATEHGFRRTFLNDPDIGGRYSALSYFGLVPAALIGADVQGLLAGAAVAMDVCNHSATAATNSGVWLGAALGELALRGRDKLTFVVDEPVASLGLWIEQLIAESTGKHGKGILPVADEPLAPPDAYGDDRVFVHLRAGGRDDIEDRLADLCAAGHPTVTLAIADEPADLGRQFFFAEFATAVAGWALGINPFDQPNVQEAKDNTRRVLEEGVPEIADADDAALAELLAAAPPHYVAIMAYTAPDAAVDAAVAELRSAIRARTRCATTFGYGPRFLHSTGQLHKGGPKTGRFLQLVSDEVADVEIPGKEYTFEQLKHAQAAGDLQTLQAHGLPAARVTLRGSDVAGAVRALTARIEGLI